MTETLKFYIPLLFSAFAGSALCSYLLINKKNEKPMVCPLKGECKAVMATKYSKFLGIPLEAYGLLYYLFILLAYGLLSIFPEWNNPHINFILLAASFSAFIFSIYLTFIQIVVIKHLCTWCLGSAALSTLIMVFAFLGSSFPLIELIQNYKALFIFLHLVGVAIGVGGATISDTLFFKFLKDFKISAFESDTLHTLSQIIWTGVALLWLSGFGIFLTDIAKYSNSSKFLTKVFVVLIITLNGALLHSIISPRLREIPFGQHSPQHTKPGLTKLRRWAFGAGAVSISSWYLALILGMTPSIPVSTGLGILIYLGILTIAVTVSQIIERIIYKHDQ